MISDKIHTPQPSKGMLHWSLWDNVMFQFLGWLVNIIFEYRDDSDISTLVKIPYPEYIFLLESTVVKKINPEFIGGCFTVSLIQAGAKYNKSFKDHMQYCVNTCIDNHNQLKKDVAQKFYRYDRYYNDDFQKRSWTGHYKDNKHIIKQNLSSKIKKLQDDYKNLLVEVLDWSKNNLDNINKKIIVGHTILVIGEWQNNSNNHSGEHVTSICDGNHTKYSSLYDFIARTFVGYKKYLYYEYNNQDDKLETLYATSIENLIYEVIIPKQQANEVNFPPDNKITNNIIDFISVGQNKLHPL